MTATYAVLLPATILFLALRTPLVRVAFERGQFSVSATEATAAAVAGYSLAIIAGSWSYLATRVLYVLRRPEAVLRSVGLSAVVLVGGSFALAGPLDHVGLAYAYSAAWIVALACQLWEIHRWIGGINWCVLTRNLLRITAAAGPRLGALWIAGWWWPHTAGPFAPLPWAQLVGLGGAGLLAYAAAGWLMGWRSWLLPEAASGGGIFGSGRQTQ